jgi:hypothetical protein
MFVIFINNLNEFWDFYHGYQLGCWFAQGWGELALDRTPMKWFSSCLFCLVLVPLQQQ